MDPDDLKRMSRDELLALIAKLSQQRPTASPADQQKIDAAIALAEFLIHRINLAALEDAAAAVSDAADKLAELMATINSAPLSAALSGTVGALNDLAAQT